MIKYETTRSTRLINLTRNHLLSFSKKFIISRNMRFKTHKREISRLSYSKITEKRFSSETPPSLPNRRTPSNSLAYKHSGEIIANSRKEILLYYNKLPIYVNLVSHSIYIVPISILFAILKTNPFYMTLPAVLPVSAFSLLFLLMKYFQRIKQRKNIIEEIWLDKSGLEIRVVYSNRQYRSLRDTTSEISFPIEYLRTPPNLTKDKYQQFSGDLFPEDTDDDFSNKNLNWFWRKYYSANWNYFLIYKYPVYAEFQILAKVFQGYRIEFSKRLVSVIDTERTTSEVIRTLLDYNSRVEG